MLCVLCVPPTVITVLYRTVLNTVHTVPYIKALDQIAAHRFFSRQVEGFIIPPNKPFYPLAAPPIKNRPEARRRP